MKDFKQFFNESVIVRNEEEFLRKLLAYSDKVHGVIKMGPTQLGPAVEKGALEGERKGNGLIVQGPDLTIYFTKANTGKIKADGPKKAYFDDQGNPVMDREPSQQGDVAVAFKNIEGDFTQMYLIPDSDIDWIKKHFSS